MGVEQVRPRHVVGRPEIFKLLRMHVLQKKESYLLHVLSGLEIETDSDVSRK